MSYLSLYHLLRQLFSEINTHAIPDAMPSPVEIWQQYGTTISDLLASPEVSREIIDLGNEIYSPKAIEIARILQNLRQRFNADQPNPSILVGRIRAAICLKQRPDRTAYLRNNLTGVAAEIARLSPPSFISFSRFQVEGWQRVYDTIENRRGIVVVAPTGSGKTEVFLMPVLYSVAQSLAERLPTPKRFILLYPRVALLKDQLARIFRYVYFAEQAAAMNSQLSLFSNSRGINRDQKIVIGFQFSGILSEGKETLGNSDIFIERRVFRILENCPVCNRGILEVLSQSPRASIKVLRCNSQNQECGAEFYVSIGRNDHAVSRPHILVTTAESLDRLYLNPKAEFEEYLRGITGIVFDEVHLYYSLYGLHIYNLVRRLEELQNGRQIARIASSATISEPDRFVAKFFYGDVNHAVDVHTVNDDDQVPCGLEILYFLQSPEERTVGAAPTLIQSVMALGHSVLANECDRSEEFLEKERAIIFADSLDMSGRLRDQITDAESQKRLWQFRINPEEIQFQGQTCVTDTPANCLIYLAGECWRAILSGQRCSQASDVLRSEPLEVIAVSSRQNNDFRQGDLVVATSTLEVGVDDDRIKSTIHYLPPRTVFSFIQRRGRAGRATGEVAYTLMILDTTPSSHFYLFRRNRLIDGEYELPLNPQNEVIHNMHNLLRRERQRMRQYVQQGGLQVGIWHWVCEVLGGQHILNRYYGNRLQEFINSWHSSQTRELGIRRFRNWITREKEILGNYSNIEWLLNQIREEVPTNVQGLVEEAMMAISEFVIKGSRSIQEIAQLLLRINSELDQLLMLDQSFDQDLLEQIGSIQNRVRQAWMSLRRQQSWGINLYHVTPLYDFFRKLEQLFSEVWILNSAPDTLKITLQALFYLQLKLDETELGNPQFRVDFYIPGAYFQSVQPVVIEIRYIDESHDSKLEEESITELSTTLIPYKPVYRYHSSPYLSTLDIQYNQEWVSEDRRTVRIRLDVEGISQGDTLTPKKVYSKSIRGDDQGQQIVTLCPQCYAMHGFNRSRCSCGERVYRVKLYAEPIVERGYSTSETRQITRTMSILPKMEGSTTVRGSAVEARRVYFDDAVGYHRPIRQGQNMQFVFDALYEIPLRYTIPTKGIAWNLNAVAEQIIQSESLREQIQQVTLNTERKVLNDDLILHSASHILQRAIAAISGVNEQELEYWYSVEQREVVVWERFEGGAGISEIFENVIRINPCRVYEELLSSVLCPIDCSEAEGHISERLNAELSQIWRLSQSSELITRVVQEARSEHQSRMQQQGEENRMLCRPPQGYDGCPACIHTTYCLERDQQALRVSRLVGEAIVRQFVSQVTRNELNQLTQFAIDTNIIPPHCLTSNPNQNTFDVLLL